MPSESDHGPRNAFTTEFLSRLDEIGEPDGAHEADAAGPWTIRQVPYRGGTGFGLLREWESLEAGDVPYAVFRRREMALLAAAVLPATGREPLFRLATQPDAAGFPLLGALATPGTFTSPASAHQGRRPAPPPPAPPAGAPASSRMPPASPLPVSSPTPAPHHAAAAGDHSEVVVESEAATAGHLRDFDEGLAAALLLAAALVRSPISLARLLEAAGYVALEQAGRILHRRMRGLDRHGSVGDEG